MSIQDISEEEAALYDRQIRLWGLEAQSRLKKTKLLLIGLSPIAAEIIKNIVLCGVDTLTICDDKVVSMDDIEQCFLYEGCCAGQMRNTSAAKRARALNEAVTITCEESMNVDFLSNKYQDYDEVIVAVDGAFGHWIDYVTKFSCLPKRPNIHCVMSFGMHAVGFADLGYYTYDGDVHNRVRNCKPAVGDALFTTSNGNRGKSTTLSLDSCVVEFPSLNAFLKFSWRFNDNASLTAKRMPKGFYLTQLISRLDCPLSARILKEAWPRIAEDLGVPTSLLSDDDFTSCCGPSSVAISAIIGGIVSQEIIQGLSHRGEPRGNWFFMDGRSCEVAVLWFPVRP